MVHEKNSRVRPLVFWDTFIHKILSGFLQPFRYVGMTQVSPYLFVIFIFICFLVLVGLFNNSSGVSEVKAHFHLTRLLAGDLNDQFPDLKDSWMLR